MGNPQHCWVVYPLIIEVGQAHARRALHRGVDQGAQGHDGRCRRPVMSDHMLLKKGGGLHQPSKSHVFFNTTWPKRDDVHNLIIGLGLKLPPFCRPRFASRFDPGCDHPQSHFTGWDDRHHRRSAGATFWRSLARSLMMHEWWQNYPRNDPIQRMVNLLNNDEWWRKDPTKCWWWWLTCCKWRVVTWCLCLQAQGDSTKLRVCMVWWWQNNAKHVSLSLRKRPLIHDVVLCMISCHWHIV